MRLLVLVTGRAKPAYPSRRVGVCGCLGAMGAQERYIEHIDLLSYGRSFMNPSAPRLVLPRHVASQRTQTTRRHGEAEGPSTHIYCGYLLPITQYLTCCYLLQVIISRLWCAYVQNPTRPRWRILG